MKDQDQKRDNFTRLNVAIKGGNYKEISNILDDENFSLEGYEPTYKSNPLSRILQSNNSKLLKKDLFEKIIAKGVSPNIKDSSNDQNILHELITARAKTNPADKVQIQELNNIIEVILKHNPRLQYEMDESGMNSISLAVENGLNDIAKMLLKYKANPNSKLNNQEGSDLLSVAIEEENIELIQILLRNGEANKDSLPLNITLRHALEIFNLARGNKALYEDFARIYPYPAEEVREQFIRDNIGKLVKGSDQWRYTNNDSGVELSLEKILTIARANKHTELVQVLTEQFEKKASKGNKSVQGSAQEEVKDVKNITDKKQAEPTKNAIDNFDKNYSENPFVKIIDNLGSNEASETSNIEKFRTLIASGANISSRDPDTGMNILHALIIARIQIGSDDASKIQEINDLIEIILQENPALNDDMTFSNMNPISLAVDQGFNDIAELLLRYKADPNSKLYGRDDSDLLSAAIKDKNIELIHILLKHEEANPDSLKITPTNALELIDIIQNNPNDFELDKLIGIFLEPKDSKDNKKSSSLLTAALNSQNRKLIKALLEYKATHRGSFSLTVTPTQALALVNFAENNPKDIGLDRLMEILLEPKDSIDNKENPSLLTVALDSQNKKLIKFLLEYKATHPNSFDISITQAMRLSSLYGPDKYDSYRYVEDISNQEILAAFKKVYNHDKEYIKRVYQEEVLYKEMEVCYGAEVKREFEKIADEMEFSKMIENFSSTAGKRRLKDKAYFSMLDYCEKAISRAITNNYLEIVKALIYYGINPTEEILEKAIKWDRIDILKILLSVTESIHYKFPERMLNEGKTDILEVMLDANNHKSINSSDRSKLLVQAIKSNNINIVRLLIEKGAKLGPFTIAQMVKEGSMDSKMDMLEIILDSEELRSNFMYSSIEFRKLNIVDLLIKKGVKFNLPDIKKMVGFCSEDMLKPLLDNNLELVNSKHMSELLFEAFYSDKMFLVSLLIEKGAKLDPTILEKMVAKGEISPLENILDFNNRELVSLERRSELLIKAIENHKPYIVSLLIKKGADINIKIINNLDRAEGGIYVEERTLPDGSKLHIETKTPFLTAVESANVAILELLMENGAKLEDKYQSQCKLRAVKSGNLAMVRFVMGANDNSISKDVFMASIDECHFEIINYFLTPSSLHLDIDINYSGDGPAKEDNVLARLVKVSLSKKRNTDYSKLSETLKILLEKGADMDALNDSGESALYHVIVSGRENLIKLFLDHSKDLQVEDQGKLLEELKARKLEKSDPEYKVVQEKIKYVKNAIDQKQAIEKNIDKEIDRRLDEAMKKMILGKGFEEAFIEAELFKDISFSESNQKLIEGKVGAFLKEGEIKLNNIDKLKAIFKGEDLAKLKETMRDVKLNKAVSEVKADLSKSDEYKLLQTEKLKQEYKKSSKSSKK